MKIILTLALSFVCSLVSVLAQKITLKTDQDPLIVKVDETKKGLPRIDFLQQIVDLALGVRPGEEEAVKPGR